MAGSAADGVRLPAAALPIADLLPDSDPQKPVVMDYRQRYEKRWTMPASTFGGYAFDAFAMTVAAMKRAATIDRAAIRDEIERTRNFVDTAGTVNMSSVDHLGLDASAFRLLEIRNGTWTLLN
jgi:branched-chain amino acid transport system substrate-binding protein